MPSVSTGSSISPAAMANPFAGPKPGWHANATSPSTRPPSTVYPLVCGFDFLYTPNLALIIGPGLDHQLVQNGVFR